jgi:hypothetical protein
MMEYDDEALKQKKLELATLAERGLAEYAVNKTLIAELVVDAFADISAPEKPPIFAELIVLNVKDAKGPKPEAG